MLVQTVWYIAIDWPDVCSLTNPLHFVKTVNSTVLQSCTLYD